MWMANGKPAEPSESVIFARESHQLFMLPYLVPWAEPPHHHSSFHHDYYYDGLMNTMGPVKQQRLMDALLAVSRRKHPAAVLKESGFESHLNRSVSTALSLSKNRNAAGHSAIQHSQHEFIKLEARPNIQAFVNQTIQMVIQAVVQAIISQMTG